MDEYTDEQLKELMYKWGTHLSLYEGEISLLALKAALPMVFNIREISDSLEHEFVERIDNEQDR